MPINIFVCYKKILTRERDGRTIEQINTKAEILCDLLNESSGRYSAWRDEAELAAGMEWETEIYRHILDSDVLLLLIGPGTSQSEWVKREIALAAALGISIVPLGTDLTHEEMVGELKALDIFHLQGKVSNNIKRPAREALLSELRVDLEKASARTRIQQESTLQSLVQRRNVPQPTAPDNQRAASFQFERHGKTISIHVASGDIAKVRGIDVLVNSENDYMQMARFFESRTISSTLRRLGACMRGGRYEDIIQNELDHQLRGRVRPFQAAEVFATSAGGPDSDLSRQNRARYILHVAAVQAVVAEGRVVPFQQPHQIEACVRQSLAKLCEINNAKGVISPTGTPQRLEQERLAGNGSGAVRSVIFPLFGAGQGGGTPAEVLGPMLAGMETFWEDVEGAELADVLTDIYISAFKEHEAAATIEFLRARFPAAQSAHSTASS